MSANLAPDWGSSSVPALAKHLGIAPQKVLAWIRSGELIAHNIGTRATARAVYRIDRADFEGFWASRATGKRPAKTHRRRTLAAKSFV